MSEQIKRYMQHVPLTEAIPAVVSLYPGATQYVRAADHDAALAAKDDRIASLIATLEAAWPLINGATDEFHDRISRELGEQNVIAAQPAPLSASPAEEGREVPIDLSDDEIVEIMRTELNPADGGYVCDTGSEELVKGIRLVIARLNRRAIPVELLERLLDTGYSVSIANELRALLGKGGE